jgi:hypothetical protein
MEMRGSRFAVPNKEQRPSDRSGRSAVWVIPQFDVDFPPSRTPGPARDDTTIIIPIPIPPAGSRVEVDAPAVERREESRVQCRR